MQRACTFFIAAVLAVSLSLPATGLAGWGARKKTEKSARKQQTAKRKWSSKTRRGHRGKSKATSSTTGKAGRSKAQGPLSVRVEQVLARGRRLKINAALPLLREAVTARQMTIAVALAEAIVAARSVSPQQLVDAARTLGPQNLPVQRQMWARAYKGRSPRYLKTRIAEGYVDALLAPGDYKTAENVLTESIRAARGGGARGLLERLVAWGKLTGRVDDVVAILRGRRDPDAAVLLARLHGETNGDEAALQTLRSAWKKFPGHRWLQADYLKLLSRLGYREELTATVTKVVRLSPGDPMPFVQVLDAHIGARDVRGARKLIDRLLSRYPRHDVLIESLIDREQRLGDDGKRLTTLYEALLKAAPTQPSYAEAYAEWLLGRGGKAHKKAMVVLARLAAMGRDRVRGQQRAATLLQTHGYTAEALKMLTALKLKAPDNRGVDRQMALLFGQIGRLADSEKLWLELSQLSVGATPADRQQAAEARRNLVAMYRRRGLAAALKRLADLLATGKASLGQTLLYMDVHSAARDAEALPPDAPAPQTLSHGQFAKDPEILARAAKHALQNQRRMDALTILRTLAEVDAAAAEPLALALVQQALVAADVKVANGAEALLRSGKHVPTSLLLRLGNLRLRHGDRPAAAELYRLAAVQNPRDTRAMYRLAQLFRHAGQAEHETNALREIVLRTSDSDELEKAGQRLLTLAMANGACTDLLRWLDAITPQHPRRSILRRFRLLAYDAWLRSEPLEQRIAKPGRLQPQPALLSEALASGDLAMKVRALRQLASTSRPLPPALARRLLKDANAVVRRDATIALAASGDVNAAKLLVEMDVENHGSVIVARLLAFGRLPQVDAALPLLQSRLESKVSRYSELAALALGRVGERSTVVRLLDKLRNTRGARPAAAIALGNLLYKYPDHAHAEDVISGLAALTFPDNHTNQLRSFFTPYAAMWALAATGREDARAVLLNRAARARSAILRRLALRLAAAERPALGPETWDVELNWSDQGSVSRQVIRKLLLPWLSPDSGRDAEALHKTTEKLSVLLNTEGTIASPGTAAAQWCRSFAQALSGSTTLRTWCVPALRYGETEAIE